MAELGSTNIYGNLNVTGEISGELLGEFVGDQATAIVDNTNHRGGDGSDHTDVESNTTHSTGDGTDHSGVAVSDNLLTTDDGTRTTRLATGDWNNYVNSGFYRGNSLTNTPYAGWVYMLIQYHDPTYVQQTAWRLNTPTETVIYSRHMNNTSWAPWIELANTDHQEGDGSDHTDVASNTSHSSGNGTDHSGLIPNSNVETGSGTFDTTPGVADTIAHSFGVNTFRVMITPTSDPGGYLGEWWATKTTSNFSVFKTGTGASITFDYIAIKD